MSPPAIPPAILYIAQTTSFFRVFVGRGWLPVTYEEKKTRTNGTRAWHLIMRECRRLVFTVRWGRPGCNAVKILCPPEVRPPRVCDCIVGYVAESDTPYLSHFPPELSPGGAFSHVLPQHQERFHRFSDCHGKWPESLMSGPFQRLCVRRRRSC